VYWGYFVFFEMRTGGQSPGKKSQKIRVVKDGGGAITFTDVAIRNLLRVVDGWPLYPVAGIVMFATRKAQRLGDLAAGTVVVSEATSGYAARADKRANTQWEREASAEALRATGLTPEEYRVLASYWARRNELEFSARQRILTTVILPVLRRRGVSPPNETAATLEYYVGTLMRKAKFAEQQAGGPAGPKEGAS